MVLKNPVAQVLLLRAGVHPLKAPEPIKSERQWKAAEPDIAGVFQNPKTSWRRGIGLE